MTVAKNRVRAVILALVAALALALLPAVSAHATGPGSLTLTLTSTEPLPPFSFVVVGGPEGEQYLDVIDGAVSVSDLALGDYTAYSMPSESSPGASIAFTLTAELPNFTGELVLPAWPSGTGSIGGTVVDDSGSAIVGASVGLYSGERPFPSSITGADGSFTFTDLPAGDYSLIAYAAGHFSRDSQLTIGDGEAATSNFVLPRSDASISGRLVDGSGAPVGDTTISATRVGNPSDGRGTFVGPDGTFTISGVGAGDWLVSAGGPGTPWQKAEVTVTLTSGQAATIADLVLLPRTTGTVFGFVSDGTLPDPISIWDICAALLLPDGTQVGDPSITGGDGAIAFYEVDPGTYTVLFTDCDPTRLPPFATTYYGGADNLAGATTFEVIAAQEFYADISLLREEPNPKPDHDATAVKLRKLRAATYGDIDAPSAVTRGDSLTVEVGADRAGEWVSVWLRTPTNQLGEWHQVGADGTVEVTVPTNYRVGLHALVVQDANDKVVGWTTMFVGSQAMCSIPWIPWC